MVHVGTVWSRNEKEFIDEVEFVLERRRVDGFEECYYLSKNKFDEMVLKGRFINARRPVTKLPGSWPCLPEDTIKFEQFRNQPEYKERPAENWNYLDGLKSLDDPREVVNHCSRDVVENLHGLLGLTEIVNDLRPFYNDPMSVSHEE